MIFCIYRVSFLAEKSPICNGLFYRRVAGMAITLGDEILCTILKRLSWFVIEFMLYVNFNGLFQGSQEYMED